MGFNENVQTLLAQRGWSQREMAAAAGISPAAVGDILEGESSNLRTVMKVAAAFGVLVADLMREEQPIEPRDELDVALRHLGDLSRGDIQGQCTPSSPISGARGRSGASVAARACLPPRLMAYAQRAREHCPQVIAGTTVADPDALADDVSTSLDDFPLTTDVLGCTVFEHSKAYTAIPGGLRQGEPARYRFTLAHELSEILLRHYLDALSDQCQREHLCDAFAAELLLLHAARTRLPSASWTHHEGHSICRSRWVSSFPWRRESSLVLV